MNKNKSIAVVIILFLIVAGGLLWWHFSQKSITTGSDSIVSTTTTTTGTQTSTSPVPTSTSSSTQAEVWGEYHVSLPDALILVDQQGRRTGKDPITGTIYNEIPGTSYIEIGTPSNNGAGELFTKNLPDGQYTLYVLGGKTGSYWLDLEHYGQKAQTFKGTIQAGSMIAYIQNYTSANVASSTFSYEENSSSTASITKAPPDNLPPQ
jgi:hypothetical protein